MGDLTENEVAVLILIERVTASISVVGTFHLVWTYLFIKDFRTLSNTIIFYASFANLFANIAALIGSAALSNLNGPLCQFQGFLLEMFMQADPMWSLAMAINVYLVFFKRFDAARLKRLYWIYAILCYGIPFVPAMVCLLFKSKNGEIYGNATLWCWINNEWQPLRIYTYYAPVWVCILTAVIIYIRVGIEIFHTRSQLRAMDQYSHQGEPNHFGSRIEPFTGLRTTVVHVMHGEHTSDDLACPIPIYTAEGNRTAAVNRYSITISSHDPTATVARRSKILARPNNIDRIKWAYTKVALLFATSILITWVPSSVNRVYGLRYPNQPSYALNVISALVLPLQGFWNTIIYFTTSLPICKRVLERFMARKKTSIGFAVLEMTKRGCRDKDGGSVVEISLPNREITVPNLSE